MRDTDTGSVNCWLRPQSLGHGLGPLGCGPAPLPGAEAGRPREHHGAQPHGLGLRFHDLYASVSSTTEGDRIALSGKGCGQPAPGTSWLPFLCQASPLLLLALALPTAAPRKKTALGSQRPDVAGHSLDI